VKSKTSIRLFMWIVGGTLTAMIIVSAFLWDGIKTNESVNRVFHKEVGEKMSDISADIRVIKSELKNK